MKKFSLICTVLALVLSIGGFCMFSAMAETTPVVAPTQPVTGNIQPSQGTQPATVPTTQAGTGTVEPTGTTAGYTEPVTEPQEPTTAGTRPTEYQDEPSTLSNYVSPAPPYQPVEQMPENDWEEIELDLSGDAPVGQVGDFNDIKKNTAKGDQQSHLLLILGIVLVFLSIAGFTFVFLYKPNKSKTAKAHAGSVKHPAAGSHSRDKRSSDRSRERRQRDDYNDGY